MLSQDQHSFISEAPMTAQEAAAFTTGVAPYMHGHIPARRSLLPGYDSAILGIFIAAILAVSLNSRSVKAFFSRLGRELWSIRRRANAFDEANVGERGAVASLVLLCCVCEGSLLFSWLYHRGVSLSPDAAAGLGEWPAHAFMLMPLMVGAALLFYLLQSAAYDMTGFTFTDKIGRRQWLRGFNASQALLALLLLPTALAALFYPELTPQACLCGCACYAAARIAFIIKGFRIFCTNFTSFVYFILYLCTLEIAPLLLIGRLCNIQS